jgi:serine/threonine protein kinase
MTSSLYPVCPQCGAALAAGTVPHGLCPSCLLTTALSSGDEPPRYRILTPIGGDALGVTYLAQSASGVSRCVSLRIVGPCEDVDAILRRYDCWKEALARIHHPGVQRLIEIAPIGDAHVRVVAEYVAGMSLAAFAGHGASGIADLSAVARQLAEAVGAAHAQNVVHLKLDASRVKIATAGGPVARILGFGTALILDDLHGSPAADVRALVKIVQNLGVDLPQGIETIDGLRAALEAR